jgi:hypothetical protein
VARKKITGRPTLSDRQHPRSVQLGLLR